jgi:hypothetical protein
MVIGALLGGWVGAIIEALGFVEFVKGSWGGPATSFWPTETLVGLARAKARGVQLGGENEQSRMNKAEAQRHAQALRPILLEIIGDRDEMSATAIATELNRRKVETPRPGSRWHAQTVIRIMRRLGMGQNAAPSAAVED